MSLAQVESVEVAAEVADGVGARGRDIWDRLRHNPSAVIGAALIVLFVLVALLAPVLAPYSPTEQRLDQIRPGVIPGPSGDHLLGLDQLGRDELSRLLYGARNSLIIGIVSLILGVIGGVALGLIAGAFGGWVDNIVMRLVDIMLAVPGLLLAIGVAALIGPSLKAVMIAIAVVNVAPFARLLRGSMLSQRESDYVLAARAVGVPRFRITVRHVLPNSVAPVIVQGTLALATAIIDAAGLAYLGLGTADPANPEWGRMLAEAQGLLTTAPRLAVFPGLAIAVTCLGFNLLGDALREALDPKLRRR